MTCDTGSANRVGRQGHRLDCFERSGMPADENSEQWSVEALSPNSTPHDSLGMIPRNDAIADA